MLTVNADKATASDAGIYTFSIELEDSPMYNPKTTSYIINLELLEMTNVFEEETNDEENIEEELEI